MAGLGVVTKPRAAPFQTSKLLPRAHVVADDARAADNLVGQIAVVIKFVLGPPKEHFAAVLKLLGDCADVPPFLPGGAGQSLLSTVRSRPHLMQ
jgi:hypothetical protein